MMRREQHEKIAKVLDALDFEVLDRSNVFFGGGTAISMMNDEYRLSTDIDFLCSDQHGYSIVMNRVFDSGLQGVFKTGQAPQQAREIRRDRDGIRTILDIDGTKIKFEIVKESRISLQGTVYQPIPVKTLTHSDLFAEKLLANTDRGLDQFADFKDMLDLLVMQMNWGDIPEEARSAATRAYGASVSKAYDATLQALASSDKLSHIFERHGIESEYQERLSKFINDQKIGILARRKRHP